MGAAVTVCSVHAEGKREALRHKWIESERANRDLGEGAIGDWVKKHWHDYLRGMWFEHLQGLRFCQEFDQRTFGVLNGQFSNPLLLDRVLDRLESGEENLDIIQWAFDWHMPMDPVLEILALLDVNSCRLHFQFP